ncbi:acetate--CoA ligase family protein [Pseudonocardia ailaonensis]|uniref:Acetate--CoA ligase family protein n=1 Tax=Pseudonocardia ailaonensis TaxID=367279 RepID=A0ABN2NMW6_9PSEU
MSDHIAPDAGPASLASLLNPRSVAVIGASERSVWSRSVVQNLGGAGFPGSLHLVNRRGETCHGLPSVRSVAELDLVPDLAVVLTGSSALEGVLEETRAKGIRHLLVFAAGLGEAGAEGVALQERLVASARANGQLILGPNNLGFVNAHERVVAFGQPIPLPLLPGGVGIVSQSGALGIYVLKYMVSRGIGASMCVTVGNEAMISGTDVLEHLVEDPGTRVVALYLEQVGDPERFLRIARRATELGKPIVLYKAGRTEVSARVAAAHTGSLVGDDRVVSAVCAQYGVIRVDTIEDLVTTAGLLDSYGGVPGPRTGFVMASGAMCAVLADRAEQAGLELPVPSPETVAGIRAANLPAHAAIDNPLDVTGHVMDDPQILPAAIAQFLDDPRYDSVVVLGDVPAAESDLPRVEWLSRSILRLRTEHTTPLVPMRFLPADTTPFGRQWQEETGHPHVPDSFERGLAALGRSAWWARRRAELLGCEDPQPVPVALPGAGELSEVEAAALLRAHGVPYVPSEVAGSAEEAARIADRLGFPVAMKVVSPDIAHKTEVGGVLLGIGDEARAKEAYTEIVESVGKALPDARVQGVVVSPMRSGGTELVVGVVRDPQWGPVLAVGFGGVLVEMLRDTAVRLLPVGADDIRGMLAELRGYELLTGFRGRPAVDLDALVDVIAAVARIGSEVDEVEVNPLVVDADRIEALDVLLTLRAPTG